MDAEGDEAVSLSYLVFVAGSATVWRFLIYGLRCCECFLALGFVASHLLCVDSCGESMRGISPCLLLLNQGAYLPGKVTTLLAILMIA